jgi:acyl-CoA hydrolase
MTEHLNDIDAAVQAVLDRVSGPLVLALPLGIGKPNPLVNALYRRVAGDPSRSLRILTALSLEKPSGHSELERHFLAPLVERVFGDYPDLDYVKALRTHQLPPNISVQEFFLKTGDYLGNDAAQQGFVCTNYSFAVRDMLDQGVNVIAQAVALRREESGKAQYSLSCNPDLTYDLVERQRTAGRPLLVVGMVNEQLPFMPGPAVVPEGFFDLMLDAPGCSHTIFAPPNAAISWADYAIGLHAASLVPDGGTLQIGIGSLGDAIAQGLLLREQRNADFRQIVADLDAAAPCANRELAGFSTGLYGCSEMLVNGFLKLIDAGLIRRRVFPDLALQQLANAGRLSERPSLAAVQALVSMGALHERLAASELSRWQGLGLFSPELRIDGERLRCGTLNCANDVNLLSAAMLGERWQGSALMHGGFFLGPQDFYQRLRDLPQDQLNDIAMTRIGFINELDGSPGGDEALKRAQRVKARFINTTMKMTLLGAASSDATATGQIVSGVGGQYNFVAQAHALPDARSVLMLRATHDNSDGLLSNIVWSHANCTIPRHLRDLVVTEYGVADLRGASDTEVIQRLLAITDSRFQDSLLREAQTHGKLHASYSLPDAARQNHPERLRELLRPWRNDGALPDFPFGTDLDPDELRIVRALKKLKHASTHPVELVCLVLRGIGPERPVPPAYLERLGLHDAKSFKDLFVRRLFALNL